MKKYLLGITYAASLLLLSCSGGEEMLFADSPSERMQQGITGLRNELTKAPWGWKITYFPNIESAKFADLHTNLKNHENAILYIDTRLGEGGHNFWAQFREDGTLTMVSDRSGESLTKQITSEFEVKQGAITQLSFTTHNYIHSLATSDFVLKGQPTNGKLVFKSMKSLNDEQEYIVMEKVQSEEQLKSDQLKMAEQKQHFEGTLKEPVLVIKDSAGKILFQSNMPRYIHTSKRYILFVKDHAPDAFVSNYYTGLGSGYSFTPTGMIFYPGFRYDTQTIFTTFEKQADGSLRCETPHYTAEIKEK